MDAPRFPRTPLLVLLAAALAVPALAPVAAPASADPQYYKVRLVNITTSYGQERWKDDPGLYGSNPVGGLRNASGQFDQAVGYQIILKVKLTDETGKDVDPTDPELPFVNLTAAIQTFAGRVDAYVQRQGGSPLGPSVPFASVSPVFFLHFDADGTDFNVPQLVQNQPGLPPGLQLVHVDITRGTGPNKIAAGQSDLAFSFTRPLQDIRVPELGGGVHTSDVPDTIFRPYNDIGYDTTVRMVHENVDPANTVVASYQFLGVPAGATVRWWALAAERVCQPPNCIPGGLGTVEIHRKLIDSRPTDPAGRVNFTATVDDLRRFPTRTYDTALVVVAATLEPQADLDATLPDAYAMGSGALRTGATEFVLPISRANVQVSGFSINTTFYEQADKNPGTPDQLRSAALAVNALEVAVYDDSGSPHGGDVVAFQPNRPGTRAYGPPAALAPPRETVGDPVLALKYRTAQLPVKPIQDAHVSSYRVMALLYSQPDEFFGLTYADRGYTVTLSAPPVYLPSKAVVWVNVTSVTTNYDLRPNEPGFDLKILAHVAVPDLGPAGNLSETFNLKEGASENRPVTIAADRPADARVVFTATTGDTLPDPLAINARFLEAPPKKNLVDRIPGFDAAPFLGALLIALALVASTRRP